MQVEICNYSSGARKVYAIVRFVDGEMQVEGVGRTPPPSLLDDLVFERRAASISDEAFLRKLPQIFNGAYIKAEFIP